MSRLISVLIALAEIVMRSGSSAPAMARRLV
jgi:hypothetical protein